ncbi:MAG: PD-(D/E)XK nuclease family protein [Planctomycetota bacterium]|jgi:hypothetical protein
MELGHLSWSQINTLNRCGEQYRRRYCEGERVPPGIALLRGRATHRANEKNLLAKMDTGELLPVDAVLQAASDAFDEAAEGEFVIDGDYEGMEIAEALGTAKDESVALAGLHAEQVAPEIEPTAIEVRIEIPPSDSLPVQFVSILDLIDGGAAIRDTKTTRKSPPGDAAHMNDQLSGQDLAFRARYQKPPEELSLDYLVRTAKKKELKHVRLPTTRTQADLAVFVRRAQAAIQMIEAEVFLPAPADSWACTTRFCGYAETCPFYRGRPKPTT